MIKSYQSYYTKMHERGVKKDLDVGSNFSGERGGMGRRLSLTSVKFISLT